MEKGDVISGRTSSSSNTELAGALSPRSSVEDEEKGDVHGVDESDGNEEGTSKSSEKEERKIRFLDSRGESFLADEQEAADWGEHHRNNGGNAFTETPPPGPHKFADWFANSKFPSEEDPSVFDEETTKEACPDSVSAIRDFMGPCDDSFLTKFRDRRDRNSQIRRRNRATNSPNRGPPRYESSSYKKVDSAVFQHYSMQLAEQHREEEREHEMQKARQRRSIPISVPIPPQKKRLFAGLARWLMPCPHARSKTKNNPIGAYQQEAQYWTRLVLILLGFVISVVIFVMKEASEELLDAKIRFVTDPQLFGETSLTNSSIAGNGSKRITGAKSYGWNAFGCFLGLNLLFVAIAFLPVTHRPLSGGSGIAEAKATLNGIILPTCTDLLTALCKAISVIFAQSASLPIGLEGPLIFIGLAIGHNALRFIPQTYPALKTDELKRDFAAVGCACGVAGAFLTPIGGVLFAMEEGASFWSPLLAWRSFSAACVTTICLYLWTWLSEITDDRLEGEEHNNFFELHNMAVFSGLVGQRQTNETTSNISGASLDFFFRSIPAFRVYDFLFFAVIGILGGVTGAIWIEGNHILANFRKKLAFGRTGKFIEIMGLAVLVSFAFWFLPLIYTKCNPVNQSDVGDTTLLRQLNCPDGYYNQLGTLFLNSPGTVGLNLLYWETAHNFDPYVLLIAGFTYHVLLLLLFGTSISMGIFIPLLFIGACYGRAFTILALRGTDIGSSERTPIVTTYTMVCSVAMLAGVARVLISISVIMVCSIGTTYLMTPFMVATLFAKVAGKAMFGRPGIYDVILEMKGIPFLEAECPNSVIMRGLCAQDIMSRPPLIFLEPELSIEKLLNCLEKYSRHLDYPVVDPNQNGVFLGVIPRSDLLILLTKKSLFYEKSNVDSDSSRHKALSFEELVKETIEKTASDLDSIQQTLNPEDRTKFLDITPYLSIGHYTVNRFTSVQRTFSVFRSLGLRTLVVTDAFGRPMGLITRHDLNLLEEVGIEEAYYTSRHNSALESSMESSYD